MPLSRLSPVRMLAIVPLVLTLAVTMFAGYTISAVAPKANAALISKARADNVGKSLPHSSSAQVRKTERIQRQNRRRGDLVFFYSGGGVYHVGIYAGRGNIWHASQPGVPVRKVKIWTSQVFYGRLR